jgi:photosystem II stability/assembly factor-like uncharacterized protein
MKVLDLPQPDTSAHRDAEALIEEARRRQRRRRLFVAAAVLVLAVAAGTYASFGRRSPPPIAPQGSSASKEPASPINQFSTSHPGGYPAGFQVGGVSALSARLYWVFGTLASSSGSQRLTIVRTSDAGASFERVPAPPEPRDGAFQAGLASLQFANPNVGYATEVIGYVRTPELLYVSHDSGASWKEQPSFGNVVALQISGGRVFAVFADCSRWAPCTDWRFGTQLAGAKNWRIKKLSPPPVAFDSIEMTTAAGGGWLYYPTGRGPTVEMTRFSATDKLSSPHPTSGLGLGCTLAATSSRVIWASCSGYRHALLARSTDAGVHFVPLHRTLAFFTLAPMSRTTALLTGGGGPWVTVTSDGGTKLRRVIDLHKWTGSAWETFSSAIGSRDGFLGIDHEPNFPGDTGQTIELFTTTDGGLKWTRLQ